ncbi:MAG: DUF1937 family protein [Humidesulfovibrio sp.]|uniref:DUF1937 family protein n=1 Tax=Humidesulfovibrio sp. TaxID=2910988 RepID=UPI0027FB4231|nr:DUF1937 family protein [Humidesulfovibrio sp.]MDQ7835494.1 DUF1937 family protein [Humidesulfovibrio sp.]
MIVYLATHYTHPDAHIRAMRYTLANAVAAWIMRQGHSVFSPISHSHHIAEHLPDELLLDHEFWMGQDLPLLRLCDAVWVYPADAAARSKGVAREVAEAQALGLPVRFLSGAEVGL